MKKILSIISAGVLALMAASCVQEDLKTFDPSKATAPVLQYPGRDRHRRLVHARILQHGIQ